MKIIKDLIFHSMVSIKHTPETIKVRFRWWVPYSWQIHLAHDWQRRSAQDKGFVNKHGEKMKISIVERE